MSAKIVPAEKGPADPEILPVLPDSVYRPEVDTSAVNERKLLRRIDLHAVPWLAMLYFLNSLDRGNIGNAKLYGMTTDIHLTDKQYLIALTVFFFPYALFELPSNMVLKRLRPSRWLAFIMFVWGIAMTMHGVITNYGGLVGLRVLLGLAEAGLYPGIVYYLSCWYKRSELGTRVALFFTSATVAGAFSGLLAVAINKMDGVGGKRGWQWIFILEGLFTVVCAVASLWILQDFPDTARFLKEEERVWMIRRLQADMQFSAAGENFNMKYVKQSLTDWKTWLAMGIYMGFDGPLFAFSLFTPTIINQATAANLLSVPVYVWACIVTVVVGFVGDRLGKRGMINLPYPQAPCHASADGVPAGLVGYIILICSRSAPLSYFAVYLAASAWVSGNVEGSYKRGATLAMAIGWGNLNGAVSANIYRAVDKPWYRMGHGIVFTYIAIGWLCSLTFHILLRRENAKREAGERDEVVEGVDNKLADERNGHFESVEAAKREKGDQWSGFRYTL
ncbi:MFS general substrate transporter [Laetiporus sulphureus 93-53]|uniref:MFS general substrate transporter n=1 Tax=Laetiporus sulphureus 93-53 TaxID=1314785 RepID=A0A165DYK3_9APHY|nr:MFS general substrate transporter [Laetiporus sulphureus 93-53]KZT05887.1 MFS general substrate transporter [Laetiporus sulphureus 93-53]